GDDTDPAEVAEQSDARGPRVRQQRCGQGDGQSDEEEGKAATGGRLGAGDDLRAQHRRPQGHERADDGQADPAEQVEQSVGGEQAGVAGIGDVAGEDDTEGHAHRQDRGGGEVVVDGPGETGGQGAADLGPQVGSVPDDGGGHGRGADDDERPNGRHHADDDDESAGVDESEPDALIAAVVGRGRGVQESLREVLGPHEDRVADRAEDEEVDHQPARHGQSGVGADDDEEEDEPDDDGDVADDPAAAADAEFGVAVGLARVGL